MVCACRRASMSVRVSVCVCGCVCTRCRSCWPGSRTSGAGGLLCMVLEQIPFGWIEGCDCALNIPVSKTEVGKPYMQHQRSGPDSKQSPRRRLDFRRNPANHYVGVNRKFSIQVQTESALGVCVARARCVDAYCEHARVLTQCTRRAPCTRAPVFSRS